MVAARSRDGLGAERGRNHLRRQTGGQLAPSNLLRKEPQCQRKLFGVQLASLLEVAQVPIFRVKTSCNLSVVQGTHTLSLNKIFDYGYEDHQVSSSLMF